jgi:two-component system chemotaxis sensor kinase CheA
MNEFIQEFLVEGGELLDALDRDFVEFEKDPHSKELVARIFRTIHTLKGTGGTVGLKKLESINHIGENILSRLRDGKLSLNSEITSALLSMIDLSRQLLVSVENTGEEGDLDLSGVIQSLTAILDGEENTKDAEKSDVRDTTEAPAIPLIGEILVQSGVVAGADIVGALEAQKDGDLRHLGKSWCARGRSSIRLSRMRCRRNASLAKMLRSTAAFGWM